jgi:hypothetical protein
MKTIFETNEELDQFELLIDHDNDLTFKSIVSFDTDIYRAFVFTLSKEEAINLANFIHTLYDEKE